MSRLLSISMLAVGLLIGSGAWAAANLVVEHPWIRAMPPGAGMSAGYAQLRNDGDAPVFINGASAEAFGSVSLHESVERDGKVRMLSIPRLTLTPGASITLQPGGKHLMLMQPQRALAAGECVDIELHADDGSHVAACFEIRDQVPD